MASELQLSESILTFKLHVNSVSNNVSALLKTLKTVEAPSDPTQGLSSDLETFHYSLVVLSYHLLADDRRYEDWCDVSRITALLKSAEQCFDRLHTLLLKRSEFYSVYKHLQASRLGGEIKHLRLRLKIYTTALSNPILLSAVHTVHLSLGSNFCALAFKALNDWIDQLTQDAIKLARDRNAPKAQDTPANRSSTSRPASTQPVEEQPETRSDLRIEREELIKILQLMIGTAMKMVKRSQRDIHTQQVERDAIEMGAETTYIPPIASASTPGSASEEVPNPNEILAFQQLALARTETAVPSSSRVAPPAIYPADDPPDYASIPLLDLSDAYNPSALTDQLQHYYANAQSLVSLDNHLEALDYLEFANGLLASHPPSYSAQPPHSPSTTDIHFLTAHVCLHHSLKRITRARQLLKNIYTASYINPPEHRYEAAHMLAQLYMFVDGNPNDPTIDWDGMSMNLDKAKEYVIAAVRGRKRILGLGHPDTQKSVELLTTLCARAGSASGAVLGELLDVLRETFEGSDDGGRGGSGEGSSRWTLACLRDMSI